MEWEQESHSDKLCHRGGRGEEEVTVPGGINILQWGCDLVPFDFKVPTDLSHSVWTLSLVPFTLFLFDLPYFRRRHPSSIISQTVLTLPS